MICLLSGGVDSVAAWRLLGLPTAVHFTLGTVSTNRERRTIHWCQSRFAAPILFRELPMGSAERGNGWLPFRNSLLVLSAAQIDPEVVLGAVAEWAPDKNLRWARRLERAVNQAGAAAGNSEKLQIRLPFAHLSKGELLMQYHQRFGELDTAELLANTWSCYQSLPRPCGKCGGCRQRIAAEHQYALLSGTTRPPEGAHRWRIPVSDRIRWVRDNRVLGIRQLVAHARQDDALP